MRTKRETRVFFRDDDVGEFSDPLRATMDLLLTRGIPCHYQVVPDFLDASSAGELRRCQEQYPDLIFFNQHGLRHSQELDGNLVHSEFDGGRPYEDQLRDIGQGRDMLEQSLSESFSSRIFTPPCHKYDLQTLRVLGDLGFEMLSASVRSDWPSRAYYAVGRRIGRIGLMGKRVSYHRRRTPDPRVSEVSIAIDVHEDRTASGVLVEKTAQSLWEEFARHRDRLDGIGVMLHHQACDSQTKLTALEDFVQRLHADPSVRFVNMHELAPTRAGP